MGIFDAGLAHALLLMSDVGAPPPVIVKSSMQIFALQSSPPPKCDRAMPARSGTGAMISGIALASQGLALHGAFSALVIHVSDSDDRSGMGMLTAVGFAALSYTSIAAALPLLGVGTYRRGVLNSYRVECLIEQRARPRLALGISLLSLGAGIFVANAVNARTFRPDCQFCRATVFQAGSLVGLSLMIPGLAWTTYAAGYQR